MKRDFFKTSAKEERVANKWKHLLSSSSSSEDEEKDDKAEQKVLDEQMVKNYYFLTKTYLIVCDVFEIS